MSGKGCDFSTDKLVQFILLRASDFSTPNNRDHRPCSLVIGNSQAVDRYQIATVLPGLDKRMPRVIDILMACHLIVMFCVEAVAFCIQNPSPTRNCAIYTAENRVAGGY